MFQVILVDYGTVWVTCLDHLRILHKIFFSLPAQAIKVMLLSYMTEYICLTVCRYVCMQSCVSDYLYPFIYFDATFNSLKWMTTAEHFLFLLFILLIIFKLSHIVRYLEHSVLAISFLFSHVNGTLHIISHSQDKYLTLTLDRYRQNFIAYQVWCSRLYTTSLKIC